MSLHSQRKMAEGPHDLRDCGPPPTDSSVLPCRTETQRQQPTRNQAEAAADAPVPASMSQRAAAMMQLEKAQQQSAKKQQPLPAPPSGAVSAAQGNAPTSQRAAAMRQFEAKGVLADNSGWSATKAKKPVPEGCAAAATTQQAPLVQKDAGNDVRSVQPKREVNARGHAMG